MSNNSTVVNPPCWQRVAGAAFAKLISPVILALVWIAGINQASAQVYHQYIVAYYDYLFQTGSNLFCVSLQSADDTNSLLTMFPMVPNGTVVSQWNPITLSFDTTSTFENGSWSVNLPLPPGIGFQLVTPSPFTNSFDGELLDHNGNIYTNGNSGLSTPPVFSGPNGIYLLGDKTITADVGTNIFINILGRPPNPGEQVIQLSGTSTYQGNGLWDSVPALIVGQAAFLNIGPVPGLPGSSGFVNLNFELANNLGSPGSFTQINPANAFPGWTVDAVYVTYDDFSLSGGSASIIDTNANANGEGLNFPTIQGKYFALLEGLNGPPFYGGTGPTSIEQTGQIPSAAKSITFWGQDYNLQISFNGNLLSFIPLSTTANYTVYGADISPYAGQTGALLFDAPGGTYDAAGSGEIDNIQFSAQPLPIPGLTINQTGAGTIVSWPLSAAGWTLQTNNNLSPDSWGNYASPIINNTVTNPPASGNLFFRLVYP